VRHALAAVGVAAALAGCGSSSGSMSAGEYRNAATKICDDGNRRAAAVPQPKGLGALRDYLDSTLAIVSSETDELRALKPPDDLEADHQAALRAQDAAISSLRALLARLKSGKPTVAELKSDLDRVQRLSSQADAAFRKLGLQRCAQ
jgi:Xaa-Pro aminopeptidase